MKTKTHIYLSLALILLSCILIPAHALSDSDYQVRSFSNFKTYSTGIAVLFGLDVEEYNFVALQPVSGVLNGTNCNLWMAQNYGGHYVFYSNANATILLTETVDSVRVNGIGYGTGSTFPIYAGQTYTVEWSFTLAPYLPFGLILGILGVAFLLLGPIYIIYQFRHHEYKALITGLVITLVGIAFIIGWLW